MANKLTKEKIDLLIEQVLSEVSIDLDQFDDDFIPNPVRHGDRYKIGDIKRIKTDLDPNPAPFDGLSATAYKVALNTISDFDGEKKNVSYNDVLTGLKSDDANIKKVATAIRNGGKFKTKFDSALIQSLITKSVSNPAFKSKITTQYKKKKDNKELVLIPVGAPTFEDIAKAFEDISGTTVTTTVIKSYFKKRKNDYIKNLYEILTDDDNYNTDMLKKVTSQYNSLHPDDKRYFYKALISPGMPFTATAQSKKDLSNAIKNDPEFGDIVKSLSKSKTQKTPVEKATSIAKRTISDPVGGLQVSYSGLSPQGSTFAGAKGVLKAKIELDPSFIATIDAIEGKNMLQKIASLANFANNLEGELGKMEVGKSASYLRLLGFLSDAAREYEDSSAGTAFETFLAAAGRGIIIGGESGAADVVTLAGGAPIYYSAKLYSSKAIEQSDQANIGFTAVAEEAVKKYKETGLIYIIGIKTDLPKKVLADVTNITFSKDVKTKQTIGKASRPKAIAMCVLNIKPKESGYEVKAISGDQQYPLAADVVIKEEETSKKAHLGGLVQEVANKNLWHSYVPIFSEVVDAHNNAATTGSEYIKNSIEQWGSETLKRLTNAFTHLRELDLLTQEHTAKQGKMELKDHTDFIAKIEENHTGFKEDYDAVASAIDPSATSRPEQLSMFHEKQTKSLKELDKLIERVILNKMNKL